MSELVQTNVIEHMDQAQSRRERALGSDLAGDAWIERISDFASDLSYDDLPPLAVSAARERLVDSVGCAIGSLALPGGCPTADIGFQVATEPRRLEQAGCVIGTGDRMSAESAAFINGCLIRYLDFSDTYPGHHPSDALGGLLAVAPVVGASGQAVLEAMVVSYEVSIRLTRSGRFNQRGWDNGFATGVGAAAGTARLIGLDRPRLREAIAIIATANVPTRATRSGQLSMWKGAATAYAVRDAVYAVQLAAEGMTGPQAPFTGRHGVIEQVTGPMELEPFPTEDGEFLIPKVKLKYWPIVHNLQGLVWAGIELRNRLAGRTPIAIEVRTCRPAWRESGSEPEKWDPQTRETADHSAPFILAYVLRHGSIDHRAFEPEVVKDPAMRPEMARITVVVDDEIDAVFPEQIRLRLVARDAHKGVEDVEIVNPLGHEGNPMGRPEIDRKFKTLAEPLLGPEGADAASRALWAIDSGGSAAALGAATIEAGRVDMLRTEQLRRRAATLVTG